MGGSLRAQHTGACGPEQLILRLEDDECRVLWSATVDQSEQCLSVEIGSDQGYLSTLDEASGFDLT